MAEGRWFSALELVPARERYDGERRRCHLHSDLVQLPGLERHYQWGVMRALSGRRSLETTVRSRSPRTFGPASVAPVGILGALEGSWP